MTESPEIGQEQPVSLLGLLGPAAAENPRKKRRARQTGPSALEQSHQPHQPHKDVSAPAPARVTADPVRTGPTPLQDGHVAVSAPAVAPARPATLPPPVPGFGPSLMPPPAAAPVAAPAPAPVAVPAPVPAAVPAPAPVVSRRPTLVDRVKGRAWQQRIADPLPHPKRVAVISLKGGSGRTSVALGLGDALSSGRSEPVAALDAVPLLGRLAVRAGALTTLSVMDVLANHQYYSQHGAPAPPAYRRPSGLSVIASESRTDARYVLGPDGYRYLAELMPRHYALSIVDAPVGLADPGGLVNAILPLSDLLVITTTATAESASLVRDALLWLNANGYRLLARRAVLVINAFRPGDPGLSPDVIADYYRSLLQAAVTVPWDAHLAEGPVFDSSRLQPATRSAYLELGAATVAALRITK